MPAVCAVTACYKLPEQCQIQEQLEGEHVNAEDNKKVILSAESRYILTENSYVIHVHTHYVSDSIMYTFI